MSKTYEAFSELSDIHKLCHYESLLVTWDNIKILYGQDKVEDVQIEWYEADDNRKEEIEIEWFLKIAKESESIGGMSWEKTFQSHPKSHNLKYYDNYYYTLLRAKKRREREEREFRPVKSIEI